MVVLIKITRNQDQHKESIYSSDYYKYYSKILVQVLSIVIIRIHPRQVMGIDASRSTQLEGSFVLMQLAMVYILL